MDIAKLRQQLHRELLEYLADLREIRDDLKSAEGWITFGLLIAAVAIGVIWALVSLGFNPPNDHITSLLYRLGMRPCRPVTNFSGVVIFIDMILMMFLTVVTLGNAFNMMRRVRQGQRREPRDLIVSTLLMMAAGIGGIIFMIRVC